MFSLFFFPFASFLEAFYEARTVLSTGVQIRLDKNFFQN